MNCWMGYNSTLWNPGYKLFQKTSDLVGLSHPETRWCSLMNGTTALTTVISRSTWWCRRWSISRRVITTARERSRLRMATRRFTNGEVRRVLVPRQSGVQRKKHEFLQVSANNPDLVWRAPTPPSRIIDVSALKGFVTVRAEASKSSTPLKINEEEKIQFVSCEKSQNSQKKLAEGLLIFAPYAPLRG